MRKIIFTVFGLIITAGLFLPDGFINKASAGGPSIDIHIPVPLPPPPPRIFVKPPEIIIIPDSPVVIAPHPEMDVFFYKDYWWCPRGGNWYRSRNYNGPWKTVKPRYIPDNVHRAPRNYRPAYEHEHRIPYGQWKKQWKHRKKMEYRERTEDRYDDRREERREDRREDRREEKRGNNHGYGHGHGHGHGHND